MNGANDNTDDAADQIPQTMRLYRYLEAQVAAAGADRASQCRAACAVVKAAILANEHERKLRVDRLLSHVDELSRGAEPYTVPPLARSFMDLLHANDGRCDLEQPGDLTRPAPRTCPCSVCAAWRAFSDRFMTFVPIENLLEQLVQIAYDGPLGEAQPVEHYFDRIFDILQEEFETSEAVEWVCARAFEALTGKR